MTITSTDPITGAVETYCDAMIFPGSRIDPPEYCDSLATRQDASGDWCDAHGDYEVDPDDYGPDPDERDEPAWWDSAEPQHYDEH